MRRTTVAFLVCVSLMMGIGFAVADTKAAVQKEPAKTPWKISGKMEEACTCNAACPCWFGSKPTKMTCAGGETVFIDKGSYGNLKLDGLAIGQFLESPEGLSMMEAMGKFKFDSVYVDSKATPEQRDALKEIAMHVFPPVAPKRDWYFVSTGLKITGEEHEVTFGPDIKFTGHLMHSFAGGSPKIVNPMLSEPMHKEYLQGTVTELAYADPTGKKINSQGTNYMYNNFTVTSEEYAKFEADMAKMMESSKK